jgi:uncharacterized protein
MTLIDVNVHLGQWPTRRLPLDKTASLRSKLNRLGIRQAWAGSFEAILHRDIDGVNQRLAMECREQQEDKLLPIGSVHPKLPDWQEDLRRCQEVHRMPGIRLYPNYHGYRLEDPVVAELFQEATRRNLFIQVVLRLEDTRTQHPLLQVPDVAWQPLIDLIPGIPNLRLVLLNAFRSMRVGDISRCMELGEVYADIAMLEGAAGLETILAELPHDRILFGTHSPFFYPESTLLKLRESELPRFQQQALESENAKRLLATV